MEEANKTLHPTAGNLLLRFRASLPAVDELDVRPTQYAHDEL